MKRIPLTNGGEALVDDADYKRLAQERWFVNAHGYVQRHRGNRGQVVRMHREVLRLALNLHADHKDGNPLNNTRANLRVASARQNAGNQKLRKDNRTGYKGVGLNDNKAYPFKVLISDHGKVIQLGIFRNAEEAARAYDEAARRVFGEFARVNFPLPGEQGVRDGQ